MSVINGVIPPQTHEIIHDRIGEILKSEIENQYLLTYDKTFNVNIYKERHVPFHEAEVPVLNVLFERGDFMQQHQGQTKGDYRYHIEIVADAKTTDSKRGDELSAVKLQKLMGVVQYILEDPKYKTLGFAPPFIEHRFVENIWFAPDTKQDADYSLKGFVTFIVRAPRANALIEAQLIQGNTTNVKLDITDKGYLWILDSSELFDYTFDNSFN